MLNFAKVFIFKLFSTSCNNDKLNPWFVTGLIDAEGCFNISLSKSLKKSKLGWVVQARLIVELHLKDLALLRELQSNFGGIGTITTTAKVARFSIVGLNDIINFVLPHFDKFPLQSVKLIEFDLWRACVLIMSNKGHLTLEGLKQIFSLKSAINYGISYPLNTVFSDLACVVRPIYTPSLTPLNYFWISGFVSGEGSFNVSVNSKNQVFPVFSIGLLSKDKLLLLKIQEYFGFGRVYFSGKTAQFKVFRLVDLLSIVSNFNSFPVGGFKLYNYNLWVEIINLISAKQHLTDKGLTKILSLKKKLNNWED